MDGVKYEVINGQSLCRQCNESLVPKLRSITWGGTFDHRIENPDDIEKEIDFFLIGQNPWFNSNNSKENVYGRAFGDKSEKILIEYLTKHKFDFSKIWITNVVKCSVENNNPNFVSKAFESCKYFIDEEIKKVKAKVLVPMGNVAFDLTLDLVKNFSIDLPIHKIFHPNALSYNNSLKEKFNEQLIKLKRMI